MATQAVVHDVIIIGAGVAGCAIAKALGSWGRQVLLIERNLKEPDRIVGELLQPGGVQALGELGLGDCLHGIGAIPVKGYRLFWRDLDASFWFCSPIEGGDRAIANPEGRSFHHGRFVSKLRTAASAEENVSVLEATARELIRDPKTGAIIGVRSSKFGGRVTDVGLSTSPYFVFFLGFVSGTTSLTACRSTLHP